MAPMIIQSREERASLEVPPPVEDDPDAQRIDSIKLDRRRACGGDDALATGLVDPRIELEDRGGRLCRVKGAVRSIFEYRQVHVRRLETDDAQGTWRIVRREHGIIRQFPVKSDSDLSAEHELEAPEAGRPSQLPRYQPVVA